MKGGETIESLAREMAAKGLRSSYQRLRILQCVREMGGHPAADEVYRNLVIEIPTLAKATVYNALHAFVAAGLLRAVDTGDDEQRYDAVLGQHGHFRCDVCGSLADFAIDLDSVRIGGLERHRVTSKSVLFKGICPNCLSACASDQE